MLTVVENSMSLPSIKVIRLVGCSNFLCGLPAYPRTLSLTRLLQPSHPYVYGLACQARPFRLKLTMMQLSTTFVDL